MEKLLEVKKLVTEFETDSGTIKAVDQVSFDVFKGKTLGIVGESGCGKSVTSLSILRLIPNPPGRISAGEILFQGQDLLKKSMSEMRDIRGNQISMIFQEPMTSLNPVFTIGYQIREVILLHQDLSRKEAHAKAIEMLKLVGISSPESRIDDYPHQLSGGMRQRVMIAMALACNPKLLVADEPTTALDVTIQAQILDLIRKLKIQMGMGVILITHDLGIIAEMADEVLVMYAGEVVEKGNVKDIFSNPMHPYTRGLLRSIPSFDPGKKLEDKTTRKRLEAIAGIVPSLLDLPKGCRFQSRCPHVQSKCAEIHPPLRQAAGSDSSHQMACLFDFPQEVK